MTTARSICGAACAFLMGCSASAEPAECVARIAGLERERADYVERTTAELTELDPAAEGATLENQAKFADFMTGIEFRENRIKTERLRCPEAIDDGDREIPVRIVKPHENASDQ